MTTFLVNASDIFIELTVILIFIRVLLSWFNTKNRLSDFILDLTEPVLWPIKKILPKGGMLDFSPIVAILLLQGLQYLIHYLAGASY